MKTEALTYSFSIKDFKKLVYTYFNSISCMRDTYDYLYNIICLNSLVKHRHTTMNG